MMQKLLIVTLIILFYNRNLLLNFPLNIIIISVLILLFLAELLEKKIVKEQGNEEQSEQHNQESGYRFSPGYKGDGHRKTYYYAGQDNNYKKEEKQSNKEYPAIDMKSFSCAILDVTPWASQEEIRNAYITLIKVYHPDLYENAPDYVRLNAEDYSKGINAAYDYLKKHKYEQR